MNDFAEILFLNKSHKFGNLRQLEVNNKMVN